MKGLKVAAFADVADPGLQGQSSCKWRVDVAFAEDLFRPLNASLKTSALRSALCGPAPVRAANSWQLSLTDDNWWGWDIHLDFFTKSVESAALVRNQEFFRYSLEGSRHLDVGDHRIFLGPLLSIQEARDGGAEEYVMSGLAWGMDLRSQSLSLRVSYKAVGGDGPELPDAFDFRFSYEIDLSS